MDFLEKILVESYKEMRIIGGKFKGKTINF